MKASCDRAALQRELSLIEKVVDPRSILPIFRCIVIRAEHGQMTLTAMNDEMTVTRRCDADIVEEGGVAVPARLFADIIRASPLERVTLSSNAARHTLTVKDERFVSNLIGMSSDEAPPIPRIEDGRFIAAMRGADVKTAIRNTAFAAAKEDSRPILQGILMTWQDDSAEFVSSDGFRLAMCVVPTLQREPARDALSMVASARALRIMAQMVDSDDEAEFLTTSQGGLMMVHAAKCDIIIRLLSGAYPDARRVIPPSERAKAQAIVDVLRMRNALHGASPFANEIGAVHISVTPGDPGVTPGAMTIRASSREIGDFAGEIEANVSGAAQRAAVNIEFVKDAVAALDDDDCAVMEMHGEREPIVFRSRRNAITATHVIMPMIQR